MHIGLRLVVIIAMLFVGITVNGQTIRIVVADSLTRSTLPNASIFNHKGNFIGTSNRNGSINCASISDFPITIHYMGYKERSIPYDNADSVFLIENISELPEIVVEGKQKKMLHILAYVREYSSLASYTDTITMFREKMVDFMLPTEKKTKFKGWRYPRSLNTRSYYRYTNSNGLDSVSDRCNHHFSWSDWIGIIPTIPIPTKMIYVENGVDTINGKFSPTEIWIRNGDRFSLDINVLADTNSRKWVPNISYFFTKEDTDFERFSLKINYDNVFGNEISPLDITRYSFHIESRGRGRGMFQFNRYDQPFFVTTYAEVYILDKEFITVKEAQKWDDRKFSTEELEIFEPEEAPDLDSATLALIERVHNIDADQVRLSIKPDERLMSRNVRRGNFSIGHRAFSLLKQLTGVTYFRSHRNFNKNWNKFKQEQNVRKVPQDSTLLK